MPPDRPDRPRSERPGGRSTYYCRIVNGTQGSDSVTAVLGEPPEPPAPRRRLRRDRLRVLLVVLVGMAALAVLGGAGVFLVVYDEATKIDRTTPDGAVDNYLRAYLVERSDQQAALFACDHKPSTPGLAALRSDVEAREKEHSMSVNFSWSKLDVRQSGSRATVTTTVNRAISDGSEKIGEPWSFDVADQDGWRVCGATKVS